MNRARWLREGGLFGDIALDALSSPDDVMVADQHEPYPAEFVGACPVIGCHRPAWVRLYADGGHAVGCRAGCAPHEIRAALESERERRKALDQILNSPEIRRRIFTMAPA